jgi:hypothetical protein
VAVGSFVLENINDELLQVFLLFVE